MNFIKTILLAVSLSLAFLFIIFFTASAKEQERAVLRYPQPYQIIEILPNGERGETFAGQSENTKLYQIATDLGAGPFAEDRISAFPEYNDFIGRRITLYRAPTIAIIDQNREKNYRSFQKTVAELFSEKNIVLGSDDKINFSLDSEITPNMTIKIIRVARTQVVERQTIDYKVIKKDDPDIDKGKTIVHKVGKRGEKKLTYAVVRENGIEISKKLISAEVTVEPVNEVQLIGTKPVITVRCGGFDDTVLLASIKYKQDPNKLCNLMMKESNGNPKSEGGAYKGLYQYDIDFWPSASAKAGFAGADWRDSVAQIYTTAFYFSIGQSWRW